MTARSSRPQAGSHAVTLTRHFEEDPETLFRAFTDPAALRQWWGPRDFRIDAIHFPARVGETYHVALTAPDGSCWRHEGQFLDVDPPRRLVYTWRWVEGPISRGETLVELTFAPAASGTFVTVVHSQFVSDGECDAHAGGWTDTFERLSVWSSSRGR